MSELVALDTNVYISALRSRERLLALKRFRLRSGHRMRLSAVVALELRAGALTRAHEDAVEELVAPYLARDLVLGPSFECFVQAGRVLSSLAQRERGSLADAPRSFINDVLLAASCRENDVTLVSENARDFKTIQRHLRGFRFTSLF
ncbi:MAG TPA: type II toxin-antitoxin system VapC family toxin [Gemmatimonadaceae bacterium]|nr:type II toxin-antitoxin system VapC family toxin [Gemmatimonadaceae bacterium]